MGQSALRDRGTPFRRPGITVQARRLSKGNRVNIPEPRHGERVLHGGTECGNANEPGDAGEGPEESSLFFIRGRTPWNRLGRR